MSRPAKPVLVLDWDGTCVRSAYPGQGDWMPDAPDVLRYLAQYCHLIVSSCRIAPVAANDWVTPLPLERVDGEVAYIRAMLDNASLAEATIWDYRERTFKPPAAAYLDDKNVVYTGRPGSWRALVPKLLGMAGYTDRSILFPKEVHESS